LYQDGYNLNQSTGNKRVEKLLVPKFLYNKKFFKRTKLIYRKRSSSL